MSRAPEIRWPIAAFDTARTPNVLDKPAQLESLIELQYHGEIESIFDRNCRLLRLEVTGEICALEILDVDPQERLFRSRARTALRLYGETSIWRWHRLIHSDETDTRGCTSDELWARLGDRFSD